MTANRLEIDDAGRMWCRACGHKLHEHDRERVYPDDGPTGSWHYEYVCTEGPGYVATDAVAAPMAVPGGGAQ